MNEMTNQAAQTMPDSMKIAERAQEILGETPDRGRIAIRLAQLEFAALSQTAGVAEGWKLVPMEPTREMQKAYFESIDKHLERAMTSPFFGRFDNHRLAYRAMLAAAPAASGGEDDMCPNCVTPWKCNGPHEPLPAASGGEVSHVTIDFPQVGTAGPFKVIDGRMTLPDVTMNDLIHHARMGYAPAPNPPAATSVSERARAMVDEVIEAAFGLESAEASRCPGENTDVQRDRLSQARSTLEQALTQQRGEPVAWQMRCRYWDGAPWSEWQTFPSNEARELDWAPYKDSQWLRETRELYTTPQPSADAVRELVATWRKRAARKRFVGLKTEALLDEAHAHELESLLSGGSHA